MNRHSVAQPCSEVEMRGHVANLIGLADRRIKCKGGRPHIAVNPSDEAQFSLRPVFPLLVPRLLGKGEDLVPIGKSSRRVCIEVDISQQSQCVDSKWDVVLNEWVGQDLDDLGPNRSVGAVLEVAVEPPYFCV